MSLTSPWPIRIQTFVLRHHGTYELSFLSKCLAPHVNVRKQNLDSQNESETCTIFSVRSGGGLFFTQSGTLLLTQMLQHCAPSFAQNRFVMYITHVHRYVCYVFHLIM